MRGHTLPYSIVVPDGWSVAGSPPGSFDLLARRDQLCLAVLAEEGSMGSPEASVAAARLRLEKSATDLSFGQPSKVRIDGHDWLEFTARCLLGKLHFAFLYSVYTGAEGSFQVVSWTTPEAFDQSLVTMRSLAQGFRFPLPDEASPSPIPGATPPPQTVRDTAGIYQLTIPGDWRVIRPAGDYDLAVAHRSLYIGVKHESNPAGLKPDGALRMIQGYLRDSTTELWVGPPAALQINGTEWWCFEARYRIKGLAMSYQYYVTSRPEGVYRMVGWTMRDLYDRDAAVLRETAATFEFESTASPVLKAP